MISRRPIPFQDESLVELAVTVLGESGLLYALVAEGGEIAVVLSCASCRLCHLLASSRSPLVQVACPRFSGSPGHASGSDPTALLGRECRVLAFRSISLVETFTHRLVAPAQRVRVVWEPLHVSCAAQTQGLRTPAATTVCALGPGAFFTRPPAVVFYGLATYFIFITFTFCSLKPLPVSIVLQFCVMNTHFFSFFNKHFTHVIKFSKITFILQMT